MAKYRLKSAVVNATQWNAPGDHPAVRPPLSYELLHVYAGKNMTGKGLLQSHGGVAVVNPGDFIVDDGKGGYFAVPAVNFNATYEVAP